jgi:hypothetical protein
MNEKQQKPIFDLEERTFQFAKKVRLWVKKIPKTVENIEDSRETTIYLMLKLESTCFRKLLN